MTESDISLVQTHNLSNNPADNTDVNNDTLPQQQSASDSEEPKQVAIGTETIAGNISHAQVNAIQENTVDSTDANSDTASQPQSAPDSEEPKQVQSMTETDVLYTGK